jgi:hypothetical protein
MAVKVSKWLYHSAETNYNYYVNLLCFTQNKAYFIRVVHLTPKTLDLESSSE